MSADVQGGGAPDRVGAPSVRPGSPAAWVLAARPRTLAAAFVPVAVGTACAYAAGGLRWGPTLAALLGAFLLQIGANFANDLFDFEKGADTAERVGPTRAVQAGLLAPRAVRRSMVLVFVLALLIGVYLTVVAGWVVVAIGLASIASAIAYTGGPYPLGYHGLGDLFVLVFFGFVAVAGTALVQAGSVPELAWWAALPVGCLATAILVVNNLRDVDTDRRAGKRTLAVRFGERGAVLEYSLLIGLAYAVPVFLAVTGRAAAWALLPLLTLPRALGLAIGVARQRGRALNPLLGKTALLLLLHGVLFAAGLALGGRQG
ncbi:MAG TPA: 1,4-dihydroxy-2-naphthoate polyprenyltransferase [Thermoanaerobaculia bacterium]|nr:1,4-dihydroxy-2-naphthoate polyprenyltransferase [Thermoanaerobaculia bacterium]